MLRGATSGSGGAGDAERWMLRGPIGRMGAVDCMLERWDYNDAQVEEGAFDAFVSTIGTARLKSDEEW
jgi:hypothetical protein